jgi:hypothetical protein
LSQALAHDAPAKQINANFAELKRAVMFEIVREQPPAVNVAYRRIAALRSGRIEGPEPVKKQSYGSTRGHVSAAGFA